MQSLMSFGLKNGIEIIVCKIGIGFHQSYTRKVVKNKTDPQFEQFLLRIIFFFSIFA